MKSSNRWTSKVTAAALTLAVQIAVAAQPASAPHPHKQYPIDQFMATVSVFGASFSADETRILFSSNKTGVFNVYAVPAKGGEPTQITHSTTDSTYAASYFPQDDRLLFMKDNGGNELTHLYVLSPDGKERDITPGKSLTADFLGWSKDGARFFVVTNERDPKYFDVYRYDAKTLARSLFYKNTDGLSPVRVSGDGQWIALSKPNTTNDSDLYIWRADTGRVSRFTTHKAPAQYLAGAFGADSQSFYYLTNDGSEFTELRRYLLAHGLSEKVKSAKWDITSVSFSHDGRYQATGINEDALETVSLEDTAPGGAPLKLPGLKDGAVTDVTFSRSDKSMAFYLTQDRSPSDLYVYTFASHKLTQLTHSLNPQIDPSDLVDSQVVRFPSFDGLQIPAILQKPLDASPTHKAPAVVWVHGGPGGQTTRGYHAARQYLVNHGYVVLGVNNRGSSGYGKTFYAADDQKHGHEPLWDCVEAKKYLAKLPYVDGDHIGIVGGSYGGYMVLAALAFKPDVFAAGVDMYGVSNWIRTLKDAMPSYWEAERAALYAEIGDPVRQSAMLREISPFFHTDQIRRPLLVLQGANDVRVIQAESDDIVAALKKNHVPVEYIVFPDEGHGFEKKQNEIKAYGATLTFLDRYLRGASVN